MLARHPQNNIFHARKKTQIFASHYTFCTFIKRAINLRMQKSLWKKICNLNVSFLVVVVDGMLFSMSFAVKRTLRNSKIFHSKRNGRNSRISFLPLLFWCVCAVSVRLHIFFFLLLSSSSFFSNFVQIQEMLKCRCIFISIQDDLWVSK